MNREKMKTAVLVLTFFFFVLVLFGCPFIGPTSISFDNVFQALKTSTDNPDSQIFFTVRLSRNLLAALAGAALACAGVVFQAVLRNPLACPFTLGVASGSSFGAVIAILGGLSAAVWGFPVVTLFAFLGAMFSLLLVYSLVAALRSFSVTTLLLAGIAISFFFNALVLLAYHLADPSQSASMIHWLIGSLDMMELSAAGKLAAGIIVGFALLLSLARELNLLSAGEELARVKGVPTYRVIAISILAASLMTSAVVALTGPIAFVGLIVPHIYRLFVGNDHRFLLPASTLGGAAFLMLCDTAARSFFGASELPVGVLTAILGVPVLLFLLFRRKTYVLN